MWFWYLVIFRSKNIEFHEGRHYPAFTFVLCQARAEAGAHGVVLSFLWKAEKNNSASSSPTKLEERNGGAVFYSKLH
jgi:hypothetical protein